MSDRWMSDFEIQQSYKNAIKPSKQIKILAELNDCDPAEIEKVLGLSEKEDT